MEVKKIVAGLIIAALGVAGFTYSGSLMSEASEQYMFGSMSRGQSIMATANAIRYTSIAAGAIGVGLILLSLRKN